MRIVAAALLVLAATPAFGQPVAKPPPPGQPIAKPPPPGQPEARSPASGAPAAAQPAAQPASDTGFIGTRSAQLEIDDCPAGDPMASEKQLSSRFNTLYARGAVLYAQGDYTGAVREFIAGYCVAGGFDEGRQVRYSVLNDIGLAHERDLDYEKAIGYFERFVHDFPSGEDQRARRLIESRILVLQKLRAQILVETSPGGASVTIANEGGITGRGRSGKQIEVPGGSYKMQVELEGYEPYTQDIEVRIGKPFAYFVPLRPLRGRLSVQLEPADARVFLRDKSVERFVGIGHVDEVLPAGEYVLVAEASDRLKEERSIEVLPNRVNRMQLELSRRPQFGRRQLVAFSMFGAGSSTGGILYAFGDPGFAVLGGFGGAALGLFGSLLYLPDQVPLGTSNLTITSGLAGTVAGITGALVLTDEGRVIAPVQGLMTLLGAAAGYYVGDLTNISAGDAALFNSCAAWGTAVGSLFALSFGGTDRRISAGLILSGLGMGTVGGVLMTNYYEISRRHAFLIDIGGLVGVIGGLAAVSVIYPSSGAGANSEASNEHAANFVLGGVAIGLIGAGILTRNLDTAKIPVKPTIGVASAAGGASAPVYGIAGSW